MYAFQLYASVSCVLNWLFFFIICSEQMYIVELFIYSTKCEQQKSFDRLCKHTAFILDYMSDKKKFFFFYDKFLYKHPGYGCLIEEASFGKLLFTIAFLFLSIILMKQVKVKGFFFRALKTLTKTLDI